MPDRGIEHAGIDLAGLDPGSGGIVGTGVGNAAEVVFRLDAILEHEVARHQAARGRGYRAKGEGLALEILERMHVRVGSDEFAGELLVLLALHQGNGVAGLQARLHKGEAAEPGHVQAVGGQGLDHGGIVRHWHELDLHTQLLLKVFAQGFELAQQFSGGFIGDGRYAQYIRGLGHHCREG
ncbi:hypothetical protein D9M71_482080 [compost metagenome]